MQMSCDVLEAREITSKESGKTFTIIHAVVDIGGKREFVKFFAPKGQTVTPGLNVLEAEIGADFEFNLSVNVKSVKPYQRKSA